MEAGRETEVGQFDMAAMVQENIVRFDVAKLWLVVSGYIKGDVRGDGIPVDEAQCVDCLNC